MVMSCNKNDSDINQADLDEELVILLLKLYIAQ